MKSIVFRICTILPLSGFLMLSCGTSTPPTPTRRPVIIVTGYPTEQVFPTSTPDPITRSSFVLLELTRFSGVWPAASTKLVYTRYPQICYRNDISTESCSKPLADVPFEFLWSPDGYRFSWIQSESIKSNYSDEPFEIGGKYRINVMDTRTGEIITWPTPNPYTPLLLFTWDEDGIVFMIGPENRHMGGEEFYHWNPGASDPVLEPATEFNLGSYENGIALLVSISVPDFPYGSRHRLINPNGNEIPLREDVPAYISPDGQFIAYDNRDLYVELYNIANKTSTFVRLNSFPEALSWSPDGRYILAYTPDSGYIIDTWANHVYEESVLDHGERVGMFWWKSNIVIAWAGDEIGIYQFIQQ